MTAHNAKIEAAVHVGLKLLDKDVIKSGQDHIRTTIVGLDEAVHANAVQCMLHAKEHGDTSLMRRLLIDVLDAKTGYRRAGLINWMRTYSPMELKGDTINLSGLDAKGAKRAWDVDTANLKPFYSDRRNAEKIGKPVFQDTLLAPLMRSAKTIQEAVDNTVNGQPVDPKKPFFNGIHGQQLAAFADKVKTLIAELPQDATLEVQKARVERARLDDIIKAGEKAA